MPGQDIPTIDAAALAHRSFFGMAELSRALSETGFLLLENTAISEAEMREVLDAYRQFFRLPDHVKAKVDMAQTGATRGWGRGQAEQVNPKANPDYKQVFDSGVSLDKGHALRLQYPEVYGANRWPELEGFERTIRNYFGKACQVSDALLSAIATVLGKPVAFEGKFDPPMAMLRGNFYPARPKWAGAKDFGIAAHSDYGCVTLLATDGQAGLEVETRSGAWVPVSASPGTFIINFGEMLESWSDGQVRATPHRVVGGASERISVPLFYNPRYDVNVAAEGKPAISAGAYLSQRYRETYVHLQA